MRAAQLNFCCASLKNQTWPALSTWSMNAALECYQQTSTWAKTWWWIRTKAAKFASFKTLSTLGVIGLLRRSRLRTSNTDSPSKALCKWIQQLSTNSQSTLQWGGPRSSEHVKPRWHLTSNSKAKFWGIGREMPRQFQRLSRKRAQRGLTHSVLRRQLALRGELKANLALTQLCKRQLSTRLVSRKTNSKAWLIRMTIWKSIWKGTPCGRLERSKTKGLKRYSWTKTQEATWRGAKGTSSSSMLPSLGARFWKIQSSDKHHTSNL